jgi:hypothetical protein
MRRAGAVSVLLAAWLGACGPEPPPPPPPAPTPPPEPTLPPVADLRFPDWEEADAETFLALPPAAAAATRWDFQAGRRYAYDYAQVLNQRREDVLRETSQALVLRERNRGTFEFVAGRDRSAYAYLRIETEEQVVNDLPVPKNPADPDVASIAEAVLREDAAFDIKKQRGRADMRLFFEAILRVEPGEKAFADGFVRTRAAGRFKVERYECVRLETEFEFTARKPSEAALLRGRSVGYFAPAEGRFVRSSTSVGTSTRKNEKNQQGAWVATKIDATTTIALRLLERP